MLVVMALGGNSPLRVGEPNGAEAQWWDVGDAARALAAVAREHTVVVTHGNGLQSYLLEQALENEMPDRKLASLVIEVIARLVPVGPRYADTIDGRRFAAEFGWMVAQDGTSFRQCVPSPGPQRIVQLNTINTLIEAGVLVICACGQGMSTGEAELGPREGEVIVDTDLAAALLGEGVGADLLMLLTAAERAEVDWRTGQRLPLIGATTVEALRRNSYTPGLVGPKVDAACRFVESTGRRAAIGALAHAQEILLGDRGVQVLAPRVS
jgi:carbamate kinase